MWIHQDEKTKKWMVQYTYVDWQGKRRKTTKRGFATKKAAKQWLDNQNLQKNADLDMLFEDFLELYYADMGSRLRENTMETKRYIIELKIAPYFGKKRINEITPADIRTWQNILINAGYKQTYLKTINNQLTAIFNYASKYYGLEKNPCRIAGSMGKSRADEMQFWTKDEFSRFCDSIMNKRESYMAFMILYYTGCRIGELMALTVEDIDYTKKKLYITKSYQRLKKKDVITPPKTPKSNRVIDLPEFLVIDLQDYVQSIFGLQKADRLFNFTKHFLEHELRRGVKESGVKKIRVHDLRHSHVALLIEMGFQPLEIAERLGHEKVETTLNVYGHLYPNKQVIMAQKLDSLYKEGL